MKFKHLAYFVILFFVVIGSVSAKEEEHGKEEEFNVTEVLMHHIMDTHDWHITDIPVGDKMVPIAIHFPYIVYDSEKGLQIFSLKGHSFEEKEEEAKKLGYELDHYGHIHAPEGSDKTVIDLSITKTSFQFLLVGLLTLLVFGLIAKQYKKDPYSPPKGFRALMEPIIEFVKEDIVQQYFPGKEQVWGPFLLTLFFIIYFSNVIGLTPFGFNITGNISVTAALATLSFIVIQVNGSKDYWKHIFWFPGVPIPIKLLLLVIELIGVFAKAFALAVRLFANIVGGHFMILSLVSLMFIMYYAGGHSIGSGLTMLPISILFGLIVFTLEFAIVAPVQAYIFTLLTAVFVSSAMETHDDHH